MGNRLQSTQGQPFGPSFPDGPLWPQTGSVPLGHTGWASFLVDFASFWTFFLFDPILCELFVSKASGHLTFFIFNSRLTPVIRSFDTQAQHRSYEVQHRSLSRCRARRPHCER